MFYFLIYFNTDQIRCISARPLFFFQKKYDVFHKQEKISMVTHNVGVILILYYSLHQMWLKSTTRKDIVAKKMLLLCTPE
jgi:hydrogenase maturation factor HypF (carbamoyltransferase family)